MGLSSFNAMRARKKAKELADKNTNTIKVQEIETPVETSEVEKTEKKKKTDAEKLKKKE